MRNPDLCCTLRKAEPLQKKFGRLDARITGLRRDQSIERAKIQILELHESDRIRKKNLLKVNPLASWSWTEFGIMPGCTESHTTLQLIADFGALASLAP
jgi:phosphoadenosine phosphosulfate reductase